MIAAIHFDFPLGWQIGLPASLLVLGFAVWRQKGRGLGNGRAARLTALRSAAFPMVKAQLIGECPRLPSFHPRTRHSD